MRSALIAGAFVAGALAVPYQKRDVVTDVDVTYVTAVVTVIAGQGPATDAPAPTSSLVLAQHWGHGPNWRGGNDDAPSSAAWVAPPAPTTSSVWVAPPAPTTSTFVAPEPETTSVWVAPPAPSTTEAPATTEEAATSADLLGWLVPSSSSEEAAASTPAPSSTGPAPSEYSDRVVYQHNLHRSNHSSPDIAWDAGLAATAQLIASSCYYGHNTDANGGGYGQNIAAGVDADHVANVISDMFYNGEVNAFEPYYGKPDTEVLDYEIWGHFSQVVWAASTHVGCATQHCPGGLQNGPGKDFTVCNYKNTGNVFGNYGNVLGSMFKDNVKRPLNNPTVSPGGSY